MTKTAGILYDSAFAASAATAKAYLKRKKYNILLCNPIPALASIHEIPRAVGQLNLMVWYSHGGWDGPKVFDFKGTVPLQVSPSEPKEWAQLKAYFRSQMKPKAAYLAHSCHSAGSDWRENRTMIVPNKGVWVKDVARDMNIYTFGHSGKAAAANVSSVKKMLDYIFGSPEKKSPTRW